MPPLFADKETRAKKSRVQAASPPAHLHRPGRAAGTSGERSWWSWRGWEVAEMAEVAEVTGLGGDGGGGAGRWRRWRCWEGAGAARRPRGLGAAPPAGRRAGGAGRGPSHIPRFGRGRPAAFSRPVSDSSQAYDFT